MYGLVLRGGGVRSAYGAGVIYAIAKILRDNKKTRNISKSPFNIITGSSSGAINASYLAMHPNNISFAAERICELWEGLEQDDVYEVSESAESINISLLSSIIRSSFSYGSGFHVCNLDPFNKVIGSKIDFNKINENIKEGILSALGIATFHYKTNRNYVFYNSYTKLPSYQRSYNKNYIKCDLNRQHLLASMSLPFIFQASKIDEYGYFGDGMIMDDSPLTSAIYLGADKIIVVSQEQSKPEEELKFGDVENIGIMGFIDSLFNAVLRDKLDLDIKNIIKYNRLISYVPSTEAARMDRREIETLVLSPSIDLDSVASKYKNYGSKFVFDISNKLGSTSFLSNMLVNKDYISELITLGARDTYSKLREIIEFFS